MESWAQVLFILPFHAVFLPEFIREISDTEFQEAKTHNTPPYLNTRLLLILGDWQKSHPDVDEPHVGQHPQEVDVQLIFLQANYFDA